MEKFRALVADKQEESFSLKIKELTKEDLPEGDVTIKVYYSSVNYKDGLASIEKSTVVRNYPMVPGIDLAGKVIESKNDRFKEGDEVLITGYDLGVSHFGGYSEVARVPADWIVPLPKGLSMKEAMAIGTAGFTAALSVHRLQENHLSPSLGRVLVAGATGGVGSHAISILSRLGYEVTASTRKKTEHGYLKQLGASDFVSPEEFVMPEKRALLKQQWAAAVDPVGGQYLPYILASIRYGGSVALSGMTGGTRFQSTVFPFILRGVNLLGIDSVFCPMETRMYLWERLADEWKPEHLLDSISHEVTLDELPDVLAKILRGEMRGRTIVKL